MTTIYLGRDWKFNWRLDAGLMFLRVSGAATLFVAHGLPKAMHYTQELARIEDPFGLGAQFSLWFALLAEVACPVLIALGIGTRVACLPIIGLLLVALLLVHPEWTLAQGQFAWLLLIAFVTILLCGPGRWRMRCALEYLRRIEDRMAGEPDPQEQ
jgi:putative oxidoreductase